ncbi:MAG: c-type cytochrome [Acidobacteriota bacterium]
MEILSRSALLSVLSVVVVVGIALSGEAQEQPYRSTADGVYTERQAKRGERVHRRTCRRCHIPDFYKGGLIDSWAGNTVGALNTHIANTMPQNRPSSLKPRQYADIMAFILMINGFPAGEDRLPSDDSALARIRIERSKKK